METKFKLKKISDRKKNQFEKEIIEFNSSTDNHFSWLLLTRFATSKIVPFSHLGSKFLCRT